MKLEEAQELLNLYEQKKHLWEEPHRIDKLIEAATLVERHRCADIVREGIEDDCGDQCVAEFQETVLDAILTDNSTDV